MFRRAKVSLVVFGVVLGLGAAEIVLHFALPSLDFHFPSARLTDDQFTTRAAKVMDGNGVRYAYDAGGFRTGGATADGAASRTVLFLGDSFTQGFGVHADATFPAATCAALEHRGITARCLNAGVSGFGSAHELRLLRTLLQRPALAIDAVVFQVCPYNDLRDNWEDAGFALQDGQLVESNPPRIPLAVRLRETLLENRFARASRIVTLAANAWYGNVGADEKVNAATYELERRLLEEVVTTTQQRGLPIVLVVATTSWEVDQPSLNPFDEGGRVRFFADAAGSLGVPWIDSRTIARAPEHYIANDGHFSAAGNALVGEALAERLTPLLQR